MATRISPSDPPSLTPAATSTGGAAYIFSRDEGGEGTWGQAAKLTASDGQPGDQFGYSVSIRSGWALVGAPFADYLSYEFGATYMFNVNGGSIGAWGQIRKFLPVDATLNGYFGSSVATDGVTAIMGADGTSVSGNAGQGAVYFYGRDQGGIWEWGRLTRVTAADGAAGDAFGYSVSIDGDTALVGARNVAPGGVYLQGAAYVLDRNLGGANHWGLVKRLTAADGAMGDRFGWSVSLHGTRAIVGAPYADVSGVSDEGAAYVFDRDQGGIHAWGQVTKLTAAGAGSDDRTGWSVSVYDGTAVVGTGFADVSAELDQGAPYVYEQNQGGAGAWSQMATLAVANGWHEDNFGWSVAVDGDTAIVGAYRADVGGNADQGAAYVFDRNRGGANAWGPVATLLSLDRAAGDAFGWSVSISSNYALVGAPYADVDGEQDRGAAYLFLRLPGIPWGQGAKFVVDEGNPTDYFGSSVSISGRTIVVGADSADVGVLDQGAAYVWNMDPGGLWHRVATLTAADGGPDDSFGYSVSLDGDTVVVGARYADPGGIYLRGAAYIFDRNEGGPDAWDQVARLTVSDGAAEDRLGWSVALSGDTAVVGAPFADVDGQLDQGAAYVFGRNHGGANAWGQEAKLTRTAGVAEDWFGWSVGVSGDMAVVGAPGVDVDSNQNEGVAHLFVRSGATWGPSSTLTAADGALGDNFGFSVAANGGTVIVGACLADIGPMIDQGAAYVYAAGGFRIYLPVVLRNRG